MEQVVGDVLHDLMDLAPGHLAHPGVRIGHRGVRVDVFERDLLPRQDRRPPAEAGREPDLRVGAPQERVEDHLVERAVEVAAPVEQRLGHREALAQRRLVRAADLLDQFRHGRVFGQRLSEHGEQPVPVAGDPLALDVEIQLAAFEALSRVVGTVEARAPSGGLPETMSRSG